MNERSEYMMKIGEPLAAGLLEYEDGPISLAYCRAYRRYYESRPLIYSSGAPLFPVGLTTDYPYTLPNSEGGEERVAVIPHYAHQYEVDWKVLREKGERAVAIVQEMQKKFRYVGYWNHSVLNYKRILAEGIDGYERRLLEKPESDFRSALLDLIAGIRSYHRRALEALPSLGAPERLVSALMRVPFSPARNAYEAIVSLNFCLELDGWDNVGRIDSILAPYHKGEDLRPELRTLMTSMTENKRWSATLGPEYNGITRQVLEASEGLSRPLIELRITENTPDDIWALAASRVLKSGGNPSFYNEKAIQTFLADAIPGIEYSDSVEFAGGGCTETNISGCTYAGGTDLTINVLKIFEDYMRQNLKSSPDFESFYSGFTALLRGKQSKQMKEINDYWNERASYCFAPIRTLFVDDCIDLGIGWMQGGARYTYAVQGDSGIPNTVDSLLAIKKLVFEEKRYTPDRFLELLEREDEGLYSALRTCPSYGVGNEEADTLMKSFTKDFYAHYKTGKLDLGLGFFPTAHQFIRHISGGEEVGPTPDGRRGGKPLADSIAALSGKAVKGPTAMLSSAVSYDQSMVYGVAVTNLSLTKKCTPELLRALIEGYFAMGGTQLQITVADKNTLLSAKADPDSHRDLIVRVGGYSEYFTKLSEKVQNAVIERTVFES